VRDKIDEGRIIYRRRGFPAKHHGLFVIVQTLPHQTAEVAEGVDVPPDQGMEVAV